MSFFPAFLHSCRNLTHTSSEGHSQRRDLKTTDLSPSAVASEGNHMENASQSFQKYFLAMSGAGPMCDRLQYGRCTLAAFKKRGCQSPRMMRGASLASHSGYEVIISFISLKTRSGSLYTFTSILNLTCRFSGCSWSAICQWVCEKVSVMVALTFISRSTVSLNVGMDCLGSLTVRTCTMPSDPYQFLSRINPVKWKFMGVKNGVWWFHVQAQFAYPLNL